MHGIVNTAIAMAGGVMGAFLYSALKHGKFDVVTLTRGTLAGGVITGSVATLYISPTAALVLGWLAGALTAWQLSYFGAARVVRTGEVRQSSDVNSIVFTHGIVGLLGGVVSIVATGASKYSSHYTPDDLHAAFPQHDPGYQAGYQTGGILLTLSFAAIGGAIVGGIMRLLPAPPVRASRALAPGVTACPQVAFNDDENISEEAVSAKAMAV